MNTAKEIILLTLLGVWNLLLWSNPVPTLPTTQAPYIFTSLDSVVDPRSFVPLEGVYKANELCKEFGGIATLHGLVPPQGIKKSYVRCVSGEELLF